MKKLILVASALGMAISSYAIVCNSVYPCEFTESGSPTMTCAFVSGDGCCLKTIYSVHCTNGSWQTRTDATLDPNSFGCVAMSNGRWMCL